MVVWWLCWHRTILMRNIRHKQYSQFPTVHDFGKPWWGVAYVPCMTNPRALYDWVILWHVTCMLTLAEHWQSRRALSNHVYAHSVISMWHLVCLQHLARACSEQSRSTSVLPTNHVIQIPQSLSGFVNHDYIISAETMLVRPVDSKKATMAANQELQAWQTCMKTRDSTPHSMELPQPMIVQPTSLWPNWDYQSMATCL